MRRGFSANRSTGCIASPLADWLTGQSILDSRVADPDTHQLFDLDEIGEGRVAFLFLGTAADLFKTSWPVKR